MRNFFPFFLRFALNREEDFLSDEFTSCFCSFLSQAESLPSCRLTLLLDQFLLGLSSISDAVLFGFSILGPRFLQKEVLGPSGVRLASDACLAVFVEFSGPPFFSEVNFLSGLRRCSKFPCLFMISPLIYELYSLRDRMCLW